ncbi:MOSC domain-containing protein [Roseateles amylovorans]|uniref:MOSC domain-containing protein n=1 Tax=Roseateles amylovorans TaxID=2978473 RepID=A0ABY6B2U9_9BURK|nr:MOSC domain-containing protein [Roseateles amylovorans]UXH78546.1 MOSC domain-containing protein [Roseateles amylovorans]
MQVISLNIAPTETLTVGGKKMRSAIRKRPVTQALPVHPLGLEGDEQADPRYHGGQAKAVYAYPSEHYPFWQTVRAQAQMADWGGPLPWGAMGENLSLQGLLEGNAWIGDVLVFPDCELAVSEPRYPCSKFNAVMGFSKASKMMVESGWCGFYLAVRRPGTIAAGQTFEIRPGPRDITIAEVFRAKAKKT